MAEEQLVLFRLDTEEYAVSITHVKEIIQYKDVTRLPNAPDFMEGIISLRGKIIPVVDLAKRLELAIADSSDRQALIIEAAGLETGIVVDEVTEVIRLQDSAIEPPPLETGNGYIRGIGKEERRLLILLDADKLFGEEEIKELKKAGE